MATTGNKRASTTTRTRATTPPSSTRAAKRVNSGATGTPARAAAPKRPVLHGLKAAEHAVSTNSVHFDVPVLGDVYLPPADEMVFLGGVGVLAVVGVLEWPVALLLGVGHTLAASRRNKTLRAFGRALEEV